MSQPLVSIVVPFKNTQVFIDECIASILSQTYTNWEAVFIDDYSDDNSYKIVKSHAQTDSRIKLHKNDGNGIIDALQTAYKQSSGTYITRMDSDDIMTAIRLETMVNSLEKHGRKHLAVGQVNYFRADGLSDGFTRYEHWLNSLTAEGTNYSDIYKECVIPSPCWMSHRDDFDACDGFNSNIYPEDYELAFRFYKAGYNCIPCDKVLLHWRDYSTRTSRTHEHYAENSFLDLKVHYFLELNYNATRPLAIWGAGKKGKTLAKILLQQNIPFYWICDNPKKIGKHIYDQELFNFDYLTELKQPQSIVTVANSEAQKEIKSYFETKNMQPMIDYFFFC
ncbi:glycosyl transferase, group 2 family protein [Winogradskyella psychrotolerans RS-3]|uniref:Glycosyl transferase, group 2 family protein n=1 Tax=Winogradskyella psychrotolerans RS-3 TaxID=641526 RepID=S7VU93_9FLAO|nr:glycosyltransferase family 2 protein [Winogradskyella psychrotolerans]EPR73626.1 glycosyl transferase, group 2 family protein [Winogradskyella psychrotolerans RS-3]